MLAQQLVTFVQDRFQSLSDPEKAVPMAAYMKTSMPFYGIQKADRVPVFRDMKKGYAPANRKEYRAGIRALWALPHREEKYAAIEYAMMWPSYIDTSSLSLYERMIRDGAWWDLVDGIASNLVGATLLGERGEVGPTMDRWIGDDDLWIRRSAILAHLRHKHNTDWEQLSRHCLRCAADNQFFTRKAIGWALREYSKTSPDRVRTFLIRHRTTFSSLSIREAAKHLNRIGLAL